MPTNRAPSIFGRKFRHTIFAGRDKFSVVEVKKVLVIQFRCGKRQDTISDKRGQCSKLPVAYSPLATNFSRWRPPTCDLVAKKKKKKKKNEKSSSRESFAKKAGRSGASVLSSILPLPRLRFDRERNTDRETPTCHS